MSFGTAYATKKRASKAGPHIPEDAGHIDRQAKKEAAQSAVAVGRNGPASEHEQDADMIARIMHKRKEYAQGGVVANDVGVAEADESPAEFDDLELDDHLDGSQPVDSNEDGDADVKDDPIDRVMMKRKKDKLPRPA